MTRKPTALVALETYPEPSSDELALNAAALAAQLGADLHALELRIDIPNVSNVLANLVLDLPAMIRKAEAASRANGTHLLTAVEAAAKANGIAMTSGHVTEAQALVAGLAASEARYYDLAIVGMPESGDRGRIVAEALVFGAGRPTILIPDSWSRSRIDHVAIAWDGSRVAARAVSDAALFLDKADKATVLTVVDDKPLPGGDIGAKLAARLRRPDLAVEKRTLPAEDGPVSDTLQDEALELGAGLLVIGGYGHSRLRDFVLGGVTAGVLASLRMPVLLSH